MVIFRRSLWKLLLAIMIVAVGGLALACNDDAEPVLLATEGDYHPFNFINDDGEITDIAA